MERHSRTRFLGALVAVVLPYPLLVGISCTHSEAPPKGDVGEPCSGELDCRPELVCAQLLHHSECRETGGLAGDSCEGGAGHCQEDFSCVVKNDWTCMLTLGEGDSCHWNAQCGFGLVCNWGLSPYQCARPGQKGSPCGYEGECAVGLKCDLDVGECVGGGGLGDQCTGLPCDAGLWCSENAEVPICVSGCSGGQDCPSGFVCVEKSDYECRPARGPGESCYYNQECPTSYVCNWAQGYKCVLPAGGGGACAMDNECAEGLHCNGAGFGSGTCEAEAKPCDSSSDCSPGYWCNKKDLFGDKCVLKGTEDESCSAQDACEAGLFCDNTSYPLVCAKPAEQGAPCSDWMQCVEDLTCKGIAGAIGVCVGKGIEGEECLDAPCSGDQICLWHQDPPVCRPIPGEGDSCSTMVACAEGLVCSTGMPYGVGICMQLPLDVVPCQWGEGDCDEEQVCNLLAVPAQCTPAPVEGEPCNSFVQCAEGLSCSSATSEAGNCSAN